jgi:uncharacterized membrane protein YgcG
MPFPDLALARGAARPATARPSLSSGAPMLALLLVCTVASSAVGCSRYQFRTSPEGAQVEFSHTGAEPWQPVALDDAGNPLATPFRAAPPTTGYAFIRGVRDGYISSEPALVHFSWLSPMAWIGLAATPDLKLTRTRREEARERLAEGFVFYREEWVRPDEAALVQRGNAWMSVEEAEALDRRAAGLVEIDGEWITQGEADARRRDELLARGFQEHRGRLFPPEEAERRRAIDAQVERLFAERMQSASTVDNINFEESGRTPDGPRLRIFNATSIDLEVLISGPDSRIVALEAYAEESVTLLPGEFLIAALPVAPGVFDEFVGRFELLGSYTYTFTYLGLELGRELDEAEKASATRIERPEMDVPEVRLPEGYQEKPRTPNGQNGGAAGGAGGGRRGGGGGGGPRGGGGGGGGG